MRIWWDPAGLDARNNEAAGLPSPVHQSDQSFTGSMAMDYSLSPGVAATKETISFYLWADDALEMHPRGPSSPEWYRRSRRHLGSLGGRTQTGTEPRAQGAINGWS
jgi:hypothetical protein